jgi:hypothetical protein
MVDAGMSQRQAAKALGVDKRTIGRDLGHSAPKNGAKCPTPPEDMPTEEEAEESSQNDVFEQACPLRIADLAGGVDLRAGEADIGNWRF